MKSRSLQSKLFFAYISLACLILFSFAVFFYAFVSRQLKQSQISAMNTLNSSFQTQVDSAIRNLDAVSVNINYSNQSKTISLFHSSAAWDGFISCLFLSSAGFFSDVSSVCSLFFISFF